ncbi:MAG TPA: hypothetical protein VID47_01900 [Actinomycetota bacterium]|jgi:hypothetical protein
MELPIHVEPSSRSGPARWIPSARAVALLTLGVGIGVLASIPFGGNQSTAAFIAIAAATVAAGLVALFPANLVALGAADVLLGIAVMATAFGRLGPLYVPLLLALFVVTARMERRPRPAGAALGWEPAPEFRSAPRSVAPGAIKVPDTVWLPPFDPQVVRPSGDVLEPEPGAGWLPPDTAERPTWLAELEAFTFEEPPETSIPSWDDLPVSTDVQPRRDAPVEIPAAASDDPGRPAGRPDASEPAAAQSAPREPRLGAKLRREMPATRRMLSAARRARRAVTFHARAGLENLRSALVDEPDIDPELPPWPEGQELEGERVMVLPDAGPDPAQDGELVGVAAAPATEAPSGRLRLRLPARSRGPRTHRPPGRHASD